MRQCPARGIHTVSTRNGCGTSCCALLCCGSVATDCQREQLSYVIGTEVPFRAVRPAPFSQYTSPMLKMRQYFTYASKGLYCPWAGRGVTRVIAIVVQPGVEFDHSNIIIISRRKHSRWRNG